MMPPGVPYFFQPFARITTNIDTGANYNIRRRRVVTHCKTVSQQEDCFFNAANPSEDLGSPRSPKNSPRSPKSPKSKSKSPGLK